MANGKKANGIFTALGAATGLGNALRYPSLCFCYGGGFTFAYVLSLIFVCFPLLCGELYLGKRYAQSYDKALQSFSPKLSFLAYCAAINSAVIALYYGVISAKLGGAFFTLTAGGAAGDTAGRALLGAGALSVCAVWFILRSKRKLMAKTGAVAVFGSLGLLAVLAVAVLIKGGSLASVFRFDLTSLIHGGLWADALGQSLLALSLAGGVMPTFARSFGSDFSVPKSAAKIIGANLAGCLLGAVAVLAQPAAVPQSGGVIVALTLYPQVIASAFNNAVIRRLFGTLFFAVLWLVSIQSACSLFSPVAGLVSEGKRTTAVTGLCLLSLLLLPIFGAGKCVVMNAVDRMACSVNAVIIAFCEALAFTSSGSSSALKRDCGVITAVLLKVFCPLACGALALFAACGARFSSFPPYATVCALIALSCVFAPAIVRIARRINYAVKSGNALKSHNKI